MASVKVGINGFGRIARVVLRSLESRETSLQVCAINVRNANLDRMVYMLKYDTVFGRFQGEIKAVEDGIEINGKYIKVFSEDKPENINWASVGVEYVIESTGKFRTAEGCAKHFVGGAKKVILSAPGKGDGIPTFVMGVNNETYTSDMTIVSNASCTTNCLAPLAQVLHTAVGIRQGLITTVHAYTNDQNLLDKTHNDLYRARAAAVSMIPTSTGAAKTIGLVIPELHGRLDGMAVRVPTANVSLLDLTFSSEHPTSREAINDTLRKAARQLPLGVMECNDLPLVSADFNGYPVSCVVDLNHTRVQGDDLVKVLAWYDNEWAFANRLLDVLLAWLKP